jgi:hypothetical protein
LDKFDASSLGIFTYAFEWQSTAYGQPSVLQH